MFRTLAALVALTAAPFAAAIPAYAQKSADTLRFPLLEAQYAMDVYSTNVRGNFSQAWAPSVYDTLLGFDAKTGTFVGHLAKAWAQTSPTTYEFELRDDIKFHDGQPLTADDVVYTLNYLIDPKTNLRFKSTWAWVKSVEKLGSHKLRINAKQPVPGGLMFMAYGWPIYPKHIHEALADKESFGTHPVGTGPYRVVKLDKNTGVTAEKYDAYVPSKVKPAASIRHVIAEPIPDSGTLVAALLTGKADVGEDLPSDQAEALAKSGRFEVTLSPPGLGYSFLGFPSLGAQRVKALGDERVRTAIVKAIDRNALVKIQYGAVGANTAPAEALCFKEELGCGYTKPIPAYDPAGAKKLLAEAGYADGFDLVISCFPTGVVEATALSGMLRAVGIRAVVTPHQVGQRRQMLAQGKIDMSYYSWTGVMFDVAPHVDRHFLTKEFDDPTLVKMAQSTLSITDDAQRRKEVAKVFDYAVDKAYALPMVSSRAIYTHTKEVKITVPDVRLIAVNPHDFAWK
jgi:peptide/nickel transport system substrate-binding protein